MLLTLNMGRRKHAQQVSRANGGAGASKKRKRQAPIAKVPVLFIADVDYNEEWCMVDTRMEKLLTPSLYYDDERLVWEWAFENGKVGLKMLPPDLRRGDSCNDCLARRLKYLRWRRNRAIELAKQLKGASVRLKWALIKEVMKGSPRKMFLVGFPP